MNLELVKHALPEYAKDIRLNLSTVLSEEGAPDLSKNQIYAIALASALSTKQPELISALLVDAEPVLTPEEITAAKAAATIMAMNNVYYRFVHLVSDKSYSTMPAKLRMNVMANPGIAKMDFELMSLAASAINGCGMCMDAHTKELEKAGVSKLGIQSAIRIASVIHAVATAKAF